MKKTILIFCTVLITFSLTAFGVLNWNNSEPSQCQSIDNNVVVDTINLPAKEKIEKRIFTDFIYDVGPRFGPIKKREINNAKFIDAFFDKDQIQSIVSLKSVSIIIIKNDKRSDIREIGYSSELTDSQLKLLQSFDYSTNFMIRAEYQKINKKTGELESSHSTPHLTVVPEKQAEYSSGKDALKKFLKEKSEEARVKANVDADKLQPAKLFFTVTKKGTIENVRLDKTSNYPSVDKTMIELIKETPGTWKPAENFEGEKVDQELVVSFGLMGC